MSRGMSRVAPPLSGVIQVPGDKSIGHRACLLSALATGTSEIEGLSLGGDIASTLSALEALGVQVTRRPSEGRLDATVVGLGFRGPDVGGFKVPADPVDCGNSGTTIRLLTGALAGQPGLAPVHLTGDASLKKRPMARVTSPLASLGARLALPEGDHPPIVISGTRLQGAEVHTGGASAQVKSALLLAAMMAEGPSTLTEAGPSRDHTERMLSGLGVPVQVSGRQVRIEPVDALPARRWQVPGDPSSAAFWLAAAALVPGSAITVSGVALNPTRTGFLTILRAMGADLHVHDVTDQGGEPVGSISLRHTGLEGGLIEGDAVVTAIDELPLVACLAATAHGTTIVRDARELRVKESDRVAAMADLLSALGARIQPTEDGWIIEGVPHLSGGAVEARHDHRVAMCAAVLDLVTTSPVQLDTPAVAAVSYPRFISALSQHAGRALFT